MCLAVMLRSNGEQEVLQVTFELGQFFGECSGLRCCRDEFFIVPLESIEAKCLAKSVSRFLGKVPAFKDILLLLEMR